MGSRNTSKISKTELHRYLPLTSNIILHPYVFAANLLIHTRTRLSKKGPKPRHPSPGIFATIHDSSEEHFPKDLSLSQKVFTYELDVSKDNTPLDDPVFDLSCTHKV